MLPTMAPPRGSGRRLTAEDWIQAGFKLLADEGPNALRIGRLCELLEVTKGSFYWHFTDMKAYRASLAAAWIGLHEERRRRFESMRSADPRERLAVMMQALMQPDHWALERAMRAMALTDTSVLASVQRSEGSVLGAVRQVFVDYGFTEDEADLRSTVLLATGVGLLHEASSNHD